MKEYQLDQDLHIHTVFSTGDSAVVSQQTVELIRAVNHAKIIGISDHFDYLTGRNYMPYREKVLAHGFKLGTEVNGGEWVDEALELEFEYYIYHCWDTSLDYRGAEKLLESGKPVIIAHPQATETKLSKVPTECFIEINNRYTWRYDWEKFYRPHLERFRFVLGSDAHQPNWLTHSVALYAASVLGVENTLLF
jgi:histidinol phosphatase-like PHP family hydrolase